MERGAEARGCVLRTMYKLIAVSHGILLVSMTSVVVPFVYCQPHGLPVADLCFTTTKGLICIYLEIVGLICAWCVCRGEVGAGIRLAQVRGYGAAPVFD